MRDKLIDFLKCLESTIPPATGCHHAITYAQYGSEASGFEDRLALQIGVNGLFHCFFLDAADLDKEPPVLAEEIKGLLEKPFPSAQVSDRALSYLPIQGPEGVA